MPAASEFTEAELDAELADEVDDGKVPITGSTKAEAIDKLYKQIAKLGRKKHEPFSKLDLVKMMRDIDWIEECVGFADEDPEAVWEFYIRLKVIVDRINWGT